MTVIDLCAGGAGGWELAARDLGLDPLGIELDAAACRVREAAGLRTLQADIAALDPLAFAPVTGLVGGVPCPSFSMAGKGIGRAAIPFFVAAIDRMSAGESIDQAELDEACGDATAHLVLEPLRWALALRPRWIAQEQVEPVLPLWEATANALRAHGYSAWTGVVSSETFGTPQTRRRALLLASLDGPVSAPVATHARYVAPSRDGDEGGLFGLPERERITLPEDRHLLPWVSMAQALGWGMTARPSVSVTAGLDGGSGARQTLADARERGEWQLRANANANANASVRNADEPAPTITAGHDSGERVWLRAGTNANDTSRPADEPAPTIRFGQRMNDVSWVQRSGQSVAGEGRAERPITEPSLTIIARTDLCQWVAPTHYDRRQQSGGQPVPLIDVDRPAPTLGAEGLAKGRDVWVSDQATAVRVSIAEAARLQGFPPDHPWMAAGSKTAAYRCIGNAIPPQMALAALLAVGAGNARKLEAAA